METNNHDREHFLSLLAELMEELGEEPAAESFRAIASDPSILVGVKAGEFQFSFLHANDPETSGLFLVECALGKMPPALEQQAMSRLLHLNYQISSTNRTGFAIDQARGDAVYTYAGAIEEMTAPALHELMNGISLLAAHWRSTYFLEDLGIDPASISNPIRFQTHSFA